MEGVVAKQASARYTPEATTWVKIKNRAYSQAVGRVEFFHPQKEAEAAKIQKKPPTRQKAQSPAIKKNTSSLGGVYRREDLDKL